MRAHAHLHGPWYECRKVREVCLWGEGNTSLENPHTRTHTQHWQGSPTHGPLIRGWGFLQHGTMGSSPDCYSQALSISQPLFWQGMCWPFFCPYHRQTSSPCPGHANTHLHKATTFQRTVTCLPSIGWPHHGCFYTFSGELRSGLANVKYISMIAGCFFAVLLWVYITYSVWFSSTTWLQRANNAHAGKNIYHNHPLGAERKVIAKADVIAVPPGTVGVCGQKHLSYSTVADHILKRQTSSAGFIPLSPSRSNASWKIFSSAREPKPLRGSYIKHPVNILAIRAFLPLLLDTDKQCLCAGWTDGVCMHPCNATIMFSTFMYTEV